MRDEQQKNRPGCLWCSEQGKQKEKAKKKQKRTHKV
jgi:hypothetical protein